MRRVSGRMPVSSCHEATHSARGDVMRPLEAMRVVSDARTTPALVCARHLVRLGAAVETPAAPAGSARNGDTIELRRGRAAVICDVAHPPGASGACDVLTPPSAIEPFAQALSGLMAVHGRDEARPRRLGLDVASHAAGALAATGLIAAELARRRGAAAHRVDTSVVRAGLTYLTHQTAIATCSGDSQMPPGGDAGGPPFVSGDDVVFELEAASGEGWASFWTDLGVNPPDAEQAWNSFASRYNTASCSLPSALHTAIGNRDFAQITAIAQTYRMSICRQRTYEEVLAARDWIRDDAQEPSAGSLVLPSPWLARPIGARADAAASAAVGDLPLSGMHVVETTHGLPGPLAGQLLRMLGADVTRIEPPGGDPGRALHPQAGGVGAGFLSCNRGKTVVELDYKSPAGRAALAELVGNADVFVHNWLPGRAEALGFDATTLAAHNPALVHTTISGWAGAADTRRVGIEYFVQADSGCADGLSPLGCSPSPSRLILCGVMAALLACEATVAALCDRERTRRGQAIEASLFMAAMALQGDVLQDLAGGGERGRRCGRPAWSAVDQPLRTADGYLAVAADAGSRGRLHRLCGVDPSSPTPEARLRDVLAGASSRGWESKLIDAGIPCAVVREDLASMPLDPLLGSHLEPVSEGCWAPASPWSFT